MTYVYVIQCEEWKNPFYIEVSNDPQRRLAEHNAGEQASTKGCQWELVYVEGYVNRQYAERRERALKANRRVWRFVRERILQSIE